MRAVNATRASLLSETHGHLSSGGSISEKCSTCCKSFTAEAKYIKGQEVRTKFWLAKPFKRSQSKELALAKVVVDHGRGAVKLQLLKWADAAFSPAVGDSVAAHVPAEDGSGSRSCKHLQAQSAIHVSSICLGCMERNGSKLRSKSKKAFPGTILGKIEAQHRGTRPCLGTATLIEILKLRTSCLLLHCSVLLSRLYHGYTFKQVEECIQHLSPAAGEGED